MKFDISKNKKEKRIFSLDGKLMYISNAITQENELNNSDEVAEDFYKIKDVYTSGKAMDIIKIGKNEEKTAFAKVVDDGFSTSIEVSVIDNDMSEVLIENDKQMLAVFPEVLNENVIARINILDFLNEIVDTIQKDVRFAYRDFKIEVNSKEELSTRVYHLQILIIAALAIMNTLGYGALIRIGVDKLDGFCKIQFETTTNENANLTSKERIVAKFSEIQMRAKFIEELCSKDGYEFIMEHTNRRLIISYELTDEQATAKRLRSDMQRSLVEFTKKYMDIFHYTIIDKEEQEAEE